MRVSRYLSKGMYGVLSTYMCGMAEWVHRMVTFRTNPTLTYIKNAQPPPVTRRPFSGPASLASLASPGVVDWHYENLNFFLLGWRRGQLGFSKVPGPTSRSRGRSRQGWDLRCMWACLGAPNITMDAHVLDFWARNPSLPSPALFPRYVGRDVQNCSWAHMSPPFY